MKQQSPVDGINDNRLVHFSAIGLFLVLYSALLILALTDQAFSLWWVPLLIPVFWYSADTLSGVTHFVLDYKRTTPNSGLKELYFYKGNKGCDEYLQLRKTAMAKVSAFEKVVFDFKTHHLSPGALARRTLARLCLPGIYFFGIPLTALFLFLLALGWMHPIVAFWAWGTLGGLLICQYAHACAHRKHNPPVARMLQRTGFFMTAKCHASHHRDLGIDFCILSGWANPLVNRIFQFCRARGWVFEEGLEPI